MIKISSIFLTLMIIGDLAQAQPVLGRRASWQAQISAPAGVPGATIRSIEKRSPLEIAGVFPGDLILQVDDKLINTQESWTSATYALRAGQPTRLLVKQGNEVKTITVEFPQIEKETHAELDTFYETIISDYGIAQRTIITKPKVKGGQPAVLLIQGLSCSTIEKYSGRSNNWVRVINDLVEQSGMVVMRVDKPGVGDSEGDCTETDFYTELEGYEAAIRSLKSKPYVDTTKIIVYGASMGSALAPYIANKYQLAGVISDGTFFKTWYEHMLEIERRIRRMSGDSQSQITEKMNKYYIPLYHGMLIQKKTFQQVIDEYPALEAYNYHGPRHMYGRPVKYYQQLQDFDFAGEWESLQVPLRIMRGTNDWIMSSFDNHMIMETLDLAGHEDHTLYEYEGLDHWNTIHETPDDSFSFKPGRWEDNISGIIIKWARELVGLK
ncbi:MAG: alpha/beta fold hydrolase [Cyclobacteriaceae bacterium]|nr:alpha/beta fold hydrolase [Cyclobacteriaceae bacterium HetDA_MAG_MS6]